MMVRLPNLSPVQMLTPKYIAEYFADIAIAYQEEIKALYDIGCRE